MTTRERIRRAVHIARRELSDAMRARRDAMPSMASADGNPSAIIARLRAAEMAVDEAEAAARRRWVRV